MPQGMGCSKQEEQIEESGMSACNMSYMKSLYNSYNNYIYVQNIIMYTTRIHHNAVIVLSNQSFQFISEN